MKRLTVYWMALGLLGCSVKQAVPAKQGSTQWQPAPGSKWVNRAMPTWPPTADGDYQPIDAAALAARLPRLDAATLVEPAHQANDNPFVAQASYCVDGGDTAAVAAQVRRTLGSDGWAATEVGKQLEAAAPNNVQMAREGFVLSAYAAPGRWTGCQDAARKTYLTFVAKKLR